MLLTRVLAFCRPWAGGAALWALAATPLAAQFSPTEERSPAQKASFELAADRTAYRPGETARLVARVEVEDGWHVQANVPTYDYLIPTVLTLEAPAGWTVGEVAYPAPRLWKFAFAEDELAVFEHRFRLFAEIGIPADAPAGAHQVAARLRYQACNDRLCLAPVETRATLELRVGEGGEAVDAELFTADEPPQPQSSAPPALDRSLGLMLILGLLGGLILNGMPCVLPILSLKIFGLAKATGQSRAAVRAGALATAAGILVSFWALAGAAILAQEAGAAVGWGVQFQQPGFVAFLALVVLLFSLNLWGLFEIPLPGRLARWGDSAGQEGLGGHFASGLFATLMATPCSAPFLGTALTFALGQRGATIFAVFTAVGLGLALPYLLLAAGPGAVRWLPKPGDWMETLRGTMGFLLAGAVVWLLFVLAGQIDAVALALFEVGLLALTLVLWLRHRRERAGRPTALWWVLALAGAVALVAWADRAPRRERELAAAQPGSGIVWQPFDRAEAERLAAAGRLVFLDITADWCVTCKVNEKLILDTPEVIAAFARHEVLAMKADWTNRDDGIARFLAEHGRYGIPFYMLYRPGQPPHVFGELISKEGVAEVLAASAGR